MTALMSMLTFLTWIMLCSNNPMNLSLTVMLMSVILSIMFSISLSSWYALILFLIYIGGMMIMFSYFVSLNSNDSMLFKSSSHLVMIPLPLIKMSKLLYPTSIYYSSQINTIYSSKNTTTLLLIFIVLLMVMIIVIKVVKKMMHLYEDLTTNTDLNQNGSTYAMDLNPKNKLMFLDTTW